MTNYKTAESVSPRHPDKLCDQVSDALLDAYLAQDENSRVGIDVAGGHGKLLITGEVTSTASIDVESIAREIVGDIEIITSLTKQSPEIAQGVDTGGAGDQGIMVGYATNETAEFLPIEVVLSRNLNRHLYEIWPFDGKTQITLRDNIATSIVASFQNAPHNQLREAVLDWTKLSENEQYFGNDLDLHINPAGDWKVGGFDSDAGLTGRKLAVDNYGPRVPIGGGAFSGKDPSKVDRSAAYMARKIAIDQLKKHNAHEVYVYLAYAIGYDQPLEATAIIDDEVQKITDYNLTPSSIIKQLDLKQPIYQKTAQYGHFGHNEFSWEQ